jgi:hypothetical protein
VLALLAWAPEPVLPVGSERPASVVDQVHPDEGAEAYTPAGPAGPAPGRPWIIEWGRFVDKGDSLPDHFARKIDTRLAPPLFDLIN